MSARHSKKSKDAPSYSKDAAGSYQMQLDNPTPLNCVRQWRNITVQSTGNGEVMASLSGREYKTMAELPKYFVRDILKIKKEHPRAMDVHFLLNAATTYTCQERWTQTAVPRNDRKYASGQGKGCYDHCWRAGH
jgi:hypothetical protein